MTPLGDNYTKFVIVLVVMAVIAIIVSVWLG